jgi:hypothetical protein
MGVFDGQAASASILAVEDTIVLQIPRARLFEFLKANQNFEECSFAGTVGANHTNVLIVVNGESNFFK